MPQKHYSPQISRFLVGVLYHEAKRLKIPMTRLVDDLLRQQLIGSESWHKPENLKVAETSVPYPSSTR